MTAGAATFELSPQQRRMWLDIAMRPDSGSDSRFLVSVNLRFAGLAVAEDLLAACARVVAAQPALRTWLTQDDAGAVSQCVRAAFVDCVTVERLRVSTPEQAQQVKKAALRTPFALFESALSRMVILEIEQLGSTELLWISHHLIFDGWSSRVFIDSVLRELDGARSEPAPPHPADEYRAAMLSRSDSGLGAQARQHWASAFAQVVTGEVVPGQVPLQKDEGSDPDRLHDRSVLIGPAAVDRLEQLCAEEGAPSSCGWLAIQAVALARETGERAQVIVTPMLGRTAAEDELIGCFAELVPIVCQVEESRTFRQLLAEVADAFFGAVEHLTAYDTLISEVAPGFRAVDGFTAPPADEPSATADGRLRAQVLDPLLGEAAHFDRVLDVRAEAGNARRLTVITSARFGGAATAGRLSQSLAHLATEVTGHPDTALAALGSPQRRPVSAGRVAPDLGSVVDDILGQAERTPLATAVTDAGQAWTYAELSRDVLCVAANLRRLEIGVGSRVVTTLGRSARTLIVALAIMRVGASYVPQASSWVGLDALGLRPDLLVHDGALPDRGGSPVPEVRTATVSQLMTGEPDTEGGQPGTAAYVIYTSGTTGAPKGVQVGPASLRKVIADARRLADLGPSDRVATHAAETFDASLWEWLPILTVGGELIFLPDEVKSSPEKFWAWAAEHGVTVSLLTSSLLAQALQDAPSQHASLRLLETGAEPWSGQVERAPCPVLNVYGPTEATIAVTAGQLHPGEVTIGRPFEDGAIRILDSWLRPVRPGAVGQLFVAAGREAHGYLGAGGETARVFLADPLAADGSRMYATGDFGRWTDDGRIQLVGRRDRQVKIRGVRIELDAIERQIQEHPAVGSAVCLLVTDPGDQLVAYYTSRQASPPADRELRDFLRHRLPLPAIPTAFVPVAAFPLTAAGKVDSAALGRLPLPVDAVRGLSSRGGLSAIERTVAESWSAELEVEAAAADDDFFGLGGDSLRALRVAGRLSKAVAVRVSIADIFTHPTVAELAALIEDRLTPTAASS